MFYNTLLSGNLAFRISGVSPLSRLVISCSILLLTISLSLSAHDTLSEADEEISALAKLPLEELLKVKVEVPGAITQLSQAETPASITVIHADDIQLTPARNIYDLIEVYVPGAIWMTHEEGPHPGIRGMIVDRNYKYLLLVNGRNLNNKAHFGAKSELEMWDLNDIDRIEIIRGPGSVTYGPGAIGGIINIVTRNPQERHGLKVAGGYLDKYSSKSVSAEYGFTKSLLSLYSYASVVFTSGFEPNHYLVTKDNQFGAIGKDISLNKVPNDYFADAKGIPQVKAHIDLLYGDNWIFRTRYTQQGSSWSGNEVKKIYNGDYINLQVTQDRQIVSTLEYNNDFSKKLLLNITASFDSYDTERRAGKTREPTVADHPLNKKVDFAENEIFARSILNWHIRDQIEIAACAEYSWDRFGAGWGDDERDMRLGDGGTIVNNANSNAILEGNDGSANANGNAVFVGSGWNTHTLSLFTEANIQALSRLKILISARVDKNTYSKWLFSPRLAFITTITNKHVIKLIGQHSVRMNTASQIFLNDYYNSEPTSESLKGLELIYAVYPNDHVSVSLAGFGNKIDVIAFEDDDNESIPVGELIIAGVEAEMCYTGPAGRVGCNYSIVKQYKWTMADGLNNSGISYADYNTQLGDDSLGYYYIRGTGNNLNNWPGQAIKLFGTYKPVKWATLYIDSRIFYDFQGAQDGLRAIQDGLTGSPYQAQVDSVIEAVEVAGAYTFDFRTNLSLSFHIKEKFDLQFRVLNLFEINGNKRYAYDIGVDDPAPRNVRYIEEPRVIGVNMRYSF